MSRPHPRLSPRPAQRGAASLVVVMVLFLIVSLVAAYTSRNLLFEQRTAGNQYRSTQALEVAEAGLEWALAMLNSGRITAACTPGATTDTSFRQRYLTIDPDTGGVTPTGTLDGNGNSNLWPSCVFNGAGWTCSCPDPGAAPVLAAPVGAGVFPAFRVRFALLPPPAAAAVQPGVVRIDVNGCTRLDDACLNFPAAAVGGEGRATVSVLAALKSGLPLPPTAALTVRRNLSHAGGGTLTVVNADAATGGITVRAGGNVPATPPLQSVSVAGTPGANAVIDSDSALQNAAITTAPPLLSTRADRMFALTFAVPRQVYLQQPAVIGLDCPPGGCLASAVRPLVDLNPDRMIHVRGDLIVDAGDIGSPTEPSLLLVDGDLDLQSAAARIFGLVYARATTFAMPSAGGEIRGGLIAETDMVGSGIATIAHDAAALNQLKWRSGSFVRVPGSWRDFP